jgi:uncharacterized lipoprotein NlpE involved in copper resistance
MQRKFIVAAIAVAAFGLNGCESHQAKVSALQKEYDRLGEQFGKDCSAEYLKVPPTLSPKCMEENSKMKEAWQRLLAERAKQ